MKKREWLIGAAPDCDILMEQDTVSSHHCKLTTVDGQFHLEDLGSSNGTFVNGVRINSQVVVTAQDRITLGTTVHFPLSIVKKSSRPRQPTKAKIQRTVAATSVKRDPTPGRKFSLGVVTTFVVALTLIAILIVVLAFKEGSPSTSVAKSEPQTADTNDDKPPSTAPSPTSEPKIDDSPVESANTSTNKEECVFCILVTTADESESYRVGSAWAYSKSDTSEPVLITSGSVVDAALSLQGDRFPLIFAELAKTKKRIPVRSLKAHPIHVEANNAIAAGEQQYQALVVQAESNPDDLQRREEIETQLKELQQTGVDALSTRRFFDIGVIQVEDPSVLTTHFELATATTLRPRLKMSLVGISIDIEDPYYDPHTPQILETLSCRVVKQLTLATDNKFSRVTLLEAPWVDDERNCSGSPILNLQGFVTGVTTQIIELDSERLVEAVSVEILPQLIGPQSSK